MPNRALYWTDESKDQTINDILMKPYPWQEADTNRLDKINVCLLYTSPSPRDRTRSRMPSSA